MGVVGEQELALDHVVAQAAREIGQTAFGGFGVEEDVGLIGATVHRRAAELGEPDGFRAGDPGGLAAGLHAADAVYVRVGPPIDEVLVAENPGLARGAIGDGGTGLGGAVRVGRIEPVKALAACNVAAQIG